MLIKAADYQTSKVQCICVYHLLSNYTSSPPHIAIPHHGRVLKTGIIRMMREFHSALALAPLFEFAFDSAFLQNVHALEHGEDDGEHEETGGHAGQLEAPPQAVVDELTLGNKQRFKL